MLIITKRIYMNGKDYGFNNHYEKKNELVFIHEDLENLNRLKLRAFTQKSYRVCSYYHCEYIYRAAVVFLQTDN